MKVPDKLEYFFPDEPFETNQKLRRKLAVVPQEPFLRNTEVILLIRTVQYN
jgi:hypothetical protein